MPTGRRARACSLPDEVASAPRRSRDPSAAVSGAALTIRSRVLRQRPGGVRGACPQIRLRRAARAPGRDLRAAAKARAPESDQRSRAARRAPHRLRAGAGGTHEADPAADLNHVLPRHASMMAAFVAVGFAIAALVTDGLPSQGTGLLALAARERRAESGRAMRLLVLLVGVVSPMTLAGLALAGWVGEGLPWQWAVATLLRINAATAALFEVRIISLFCAQIAA